MSCENPQNIGIFDCKFEELASIMEVQFSQTSKRDYIYVLTLSSFLVLNTQKVGNLVESRVDFSIQTFSGFLQNSYHLSMDWFQIIL